MNKETFFTELNKELVKNKVSDIDEILAEFEEHFAYKIDEGKTEEEVVKKIGNPVDIARDYANQAKPAKQSGSLVVKIGLVISDFFVFFMFLIMWASVFVLGVFAITSLALGALLVVNGNIASLIPSMPYVSSLIFGISFFGLSVVSGIGTIYLYLYVKQWQKAYFRWHKNILNNNIYPSLSKHPKLAKKNQSRLKLLNMIGIIIFVGAFIIGYIVSAIIANSGGFWHVWEWFI
jgi:uncharacterized membrane protein